MKAWLWPPFLHKAAILSSGRPPYHDYHTQDLLGSSVRPLGLLSSPSILECCWQRFHGTVRAEHGEPTNVFWEEREAWFGDWHMGKHLHNMPISNATRQRKMAVCQQYEGQNDAQQSS